MTAELGDTGYPDRRGATATNPAGSRAAERQRRFQRQERRLPQKHGGWWSSAALECGRGNAAEGVTLGGKSLNYTLLKE